MCVIYWTIWMKIWKMKIVNSAILQDEIVYIGKRHHLIIKNMIENRGVKPPVVGVQGFVNELGEFLTREQAKAEAFLSGQLTKPTISRVLTSEDLW